MDWSQLVTRPFLVEAVEGIWQDDQRVDIVVHVAQEKLIIRTTKNLGKGRGWDCAKKIQEEKKIQEGSMQLRFAE